MAPSKPKSGTKYAFEHVSPKAQFVFYAGVFCVFAPFSLIYDLMAPRGLSWFSLLLWSAYSGVTAVGWAYSFTRNVRFLWVIIPFSFLVGTLFGEKFYPRSNVQMALLVEAIVCVLVIILGYICFIVFISGEGTKTLRLLTEIRLAKAIHSHLVPAVDQKSERLEIYGISAPASEVGGDLMDVCRGKGKTGLYIADITGHGVSAGVSMAMIKSAIRMKLRDGADLGELVTGLNDVLAQTQRPETLATFAALELHEDGQALYALAGHLPILHLRASPRGLHKLVNQHPPLGIVAGRTFTAEPVAAAPGDLFVILTDGLTEVFGPGDEEFGEGRIEHLVEQHGDRPLAEIHEKILSAARAFGPQVDDQTLLLARVRR